jgi:hypothetical protein
MLRGGPCEVYAAPLRGRDGVTSLRGECRSKTFGMSSPTSALQSVGASRGRASRLWRGPSPLCVDLLGEKTFTPTRPPTLQHLAHCGIRGAPQPLVGRNYLSTAKPAVTRRHPAPTPYSLAAARLAPRSALVAPRGSGRSRRANPQRQTRPEGRARAPARFQAVVWGPESTPHGLWKLWVTPVCEPQAGLGILGLSSCDCRGATLTHSHQARQPPRRSGSTGPTAGSGCPASTPDPPT